MKIVEWNPGYYPNIAEATDAQKKCYAKIIKVIEHGKYVDVEGNDAYLYYYIRELINSTYECVTRGTVAQLEKKVRNFINLYYHQKPKVISYIDRWPIVFDCIQNKPKELLIEDIDWHIQQRLDNNAGCGGRVVLTFFKHSFQIEPNTQVNTKYFLPFAITNPKKYLTNTGKKNFELVMRYAEQILDIDYKETGINFLHKMYEFVDGEVWIEGEEIDCRTQEEVDSHIEEDNLLGDFGIETSYMGFKSNNPIRLMKLKIPINDIKPGQEAFVKTLMREAENAFRYERGMKPIGEGWVSETLLYKQICAAMPGVRVLQHASPSFLGKQHYDVYIPKYKIAFEYQGDQHFRAVEFFGGEEGFRSAQERDQRKKRLSYENGVVLCEVEPGYEIYEVIDAIYEVMAEHHPDVQLVEKSEALRLAEFALSDKDKEKQKDLRKAHAKISEQVAKAEDMDARLEQRIHELVSAATLSRFSSIRYDDLNYKDKDELSGIFVSTFEMDDLEEANQIIFHLMEQGYTTYSAYGQLAGNYGRLGQPKKELAVLIQGKKDFGYNFDSHIKKLIRQLDDSFLC